MAKPQKPKEKLQVERVLYKNEMVWLDETQDNRSCWQSARIQIQIMFCLTTEVNISAEPSGICAWVLGNWRLLPWLRKMMQKAVRLCSDYLR